MHAEATSAFDDNKVYFDNCANINLIKTTSLAIDTHSRGPKYKIRGSIPGSIDIETSGGIGDFGRGPVSERLSRNLISEAAALAAGYDVIRDSRVDDSYYLRKTGQDDLVFVKNSEGTYSMDAERFRLHFKHLYATANPTVVERTIRFFTKSQRERAARYHRDHETTLGHIHPDRVIAALKAGMIINPPYTEQDVRNAEEIYGKCQYCSKIKGTKHRQIGTYPAPPLRPGEKLVGDIFSIMGVGFCLISCRMIKLRTIKRIKNKGADQLVRAIQSTVDVWKGYGHTPKVLAWDQEPALVSCAAEIWSRMSLRMDFTPPEGHEKLAEREVRTVKEHVYSSILSLGHAVDEDMIEGLVRDTIVMLNYMPNSETLTQSPRSILDGERLSYDRWTRFHAGQVAEFEIPYASKLPSPARKELGYILGHQGDNAIVRLLPGGKRIVIRSPHVVPISKTPAIISMIEQGITGAKRQVFNDLLQEINDNYNAAPDDVPPANLPRTGSPELEKGLESTDSSLTTPTVNPQHDAANDEVPSPTEEPPESGTEPQYTESASPSEHGTDEATSLHLEPSTVGPDSDTPIFSPSEPPSLDTSSQPQAIPSVQEPVPRRSTRQAAMKPPGYYARLADMEHSANHMNAVECARVYGKERQQAAGISEVINMIGRTALIPEDYRNLTDKEIAAALHSFMFYKAKDLLPEEKEEAVRAMLQKLRDESPQEQEWQEVKSTRTIKAEQLNAKLNLVKIRGRWVGGGNGQSRSEILDERIAPTARANTHNLLFTIAAKEHRRLVVGDIPSAFLQAEHVPADGKPVYIIADRGTTELIVKAYPDLAVLVRPNGTMLLRVAKALYGLVESAWLWYKELESHLMHLGYKVSENDRALFYKNIMEGDKIIGSIIATSHVDDIISAASNNAIGKRLEEELWTSMERKWPGIKMQRGPHFKHLSWNITQDPRTGVIKRSQHDYIRELIKSTGCKRFERLPHRSGPLSDRGNSKPLSELRKSVYRSTLQKVAYVRDSRPDIDFTASFLQRRQAEPTEQDWTDLSHLLGYLNQFPNREIVYAPKDLQLRAYADSSYNITSDAHSHYGYIITIGGPLVASKGGRIKTVVRSSTEAEIVAVNEATSEILWMRDILVELGYPQKCVKLMEDNSSCITMLQQEPRSFHSKSRHVRVRWAFFRQINERDLIKLYHCPTSTMRADLLTKPLGGKAHSEHSEMIFQGRL